MVLGEPAVSRREGPIFRPGVVDDLVQIMNSLVEGCRQIVSAIIALDASGFHNEGKRPTNPVLNEC